MSTLKCNEDDDDDDYISLYKPKLSIKANNIFLKNTSKTRSCSLHLCITKKKNPNLPSFE